MKKIYIYTLLLAISTLFACKKDRSNPSQPNTDGKKYKVTFNLGSLSQVILGSAGKLQTNAVVSDPASVRAMFDVIGYRLANEDGTLIKNKTFNAKEYTTGSITDTLFAGKYKITIYAGQTGIGQLYNYLLTYDVLPGGGVTIHNPWKDTFIKVFNITVTNSAVNQSVTLERMVGKVQVNMKDVLPPDAYSFSMKVVNEAFTFNLLTSVLQVGQPITYTTNPVIIPDSSKNKPNYKFEYISLNTIAPITFTLICKRSDGTILTQHQFESVTLQKNVNRIYNGNFFGAASGTSAFQVIVDPTWGNNPANNQSF